MSVFLDATENIVVGECIPALIIDVEQNLIFECFKITCNNNYFYHTDIKSFLENEAKFYLSEEKISQILPVSQELQNFKDDYYFLVRDLAHLDRDEYIREIWFFIAENTGTLKAEFIELIMCSFPEVIYYHIENTPIKIRQRGL